jgi:hypothetical protein
MSLVLRNEKGSQLTFNEMDGNFTYLEELSQTGSFTGSFTGDGSGLTGIPGVTPIDTGSFVSTASFNEYTASVTESVVTAIVTNVASNYYEIDGIQAPKLSFVPGITYRFDLSGIEGNHPFKFSISPNGPTEYTTGVTSGSNFIQIQVGYDTTTSLYYYCTNHNGMGNEINVLGIDKLVTTASFNEFTSSYNSGSFSGSFVGDGSGLTGIPGVTPIATGSFATTGSNIFVGNQVVSGSTILRGSISQVGIGNGNTFIGSGSGESNTSGEWNVFLGGMSGKSNTTGHSNTFIGESAGLANTTGTNNTIVGSYTGIGNTTGYDNSIFGGGVAEYNTTGYRNTFIGASAGSKNTEGFSNTFLGRSAGSGNAVGYHNVAVGDDSFNSNASGNSSVFIGYSAQPQSNLQNNQIVIGSGVTGNGSNTTTIGNSSTTATYLRGNIVATGSLLVSGSARLTGGVTGSSFTGSFVGDGSGLTGIPGVTPIDTSSFATTGSNQFNGNQSISGSITVSGSINAPGSGSYRDFINDRTKFRSIRGNGPGLFNIIEQGDTGITFAVSKITTNDLTSAITSNLSGANNGNYSDAQPTTSGVGRGARLMFTIAGGVVTSVRIFDVANGNNSYEEYGQPANRQGIGYKAGDTLTVASGTGGIGGTGNLVITLRPQDIETYLGHDSRLTFDYDDTRTLKVEGDIRTTTNLTIGTDDDTSEFYVSNDGSNSIVAGVGSTAGSDTGGSIVTGYYNTTNYQGTAVFGAWNTASEGLQTVIGLASNTAGIGAGAFIIGNGTDASTKSNLLVAQGSTVQVTGSFQVTGSANINGFVVLPQVSASLDFIDDTAAASGGVPLGGLYRSGSFIQIRLV